MDVFLNGRFLPENQAVVPIADRGFLYGDGLFETLRVAHGRPFRWEAHLDRFERGARVLGIQLPYASTELRRFASVLVERNTMPDAVLRLTLSRGSGSRGYSPAGASNPTLAMTLHPLAKAPASLRLKSASFRVALGDALTSWKTANKLLQILARAEAEQSGVDDALLLNSEGRIAEASASNVFWLENGAVCTPPISEGALEGITRSVVLKHCRQQNVPTQERPLEPPALLRADGVFLTNSVLGIVPVAELDGGAVTMSPFVAELQSKYEELLRRETAR